MSETKVETGFCSQCGGPPNNRYCIYHGERWMVDADGNTRIVYVPITGYAQSDVDAAAAEFKASKQEAEREGFVELPQWDVKDLCFLILEKLNKGD